MRKNLLCSPSPPSDLERYEVPSRGTTKQTERKTKPPPGASNGLWAQTLQGWCIPVARFSMSSRQVQVVTRSSSREMGISWYPIFLLWLFLGEPSQPKKGWLRPPKKSQVGTRMSSGKVQMVSPSGLMRPWPQGYSQPRRAGEALGTGLALEAEHARSRGRVRSESQAVGPRRGLVDFLGVFLDSPWGEVVLKRKKRGNQKTGCGSPIWRQGHLFTTDQRAGGKRLQNGPVFFGVGTPIFGFAPKATKRKAVAPYVSEAKGKPLPLLLKTANPKARRGGGRGLEKKTSPSGPDRGKIRAV